MITILKIKNEWNMVVVDIEKAFLEPIVKEDLYVKVPQGLEKVTHVGENKICHLNKAVYGLVQATRQFYIEIATFLNE